MVKEGIFDVRTKRIQFIYRMLLEQIIRQHRLMQYICSRFLIKEIDSNLPRKENVCANTMS
jgi:hypothetical protein